MIRKVLFVDDDQILRAAIEKRLERYSDQFQLITAVDGFDAVGKLKQHEVSLVVLDLVMPRMDGVSLINYLSQTYPDLPIIIVSGIGEKKVAEVARSSTVHGHLNKPFQADALVRLIEEVLHKEAEGGIMHQVSPPVFMQLMEIDARTCTIRILDNLSEKGGILHFSQGELCDARVGDVSGLAAAHQIFGWDQATIFISNECKKTKNCINATLGSIIMKAVGMKDETEDRPEDYGEQASIASISDGGEDYGEGQKDLSDDGSPVGKGSVLTIEVLQKDLESVDGITSISADARYEQAVDQLSVLGEASGYGRLVTASLDEGLNSARIIVPTRPTAVIRASSSAASRIEISVQQRLQGG
jgi:CheY-like chemotaxis protein